ncbi:hypothetical protein PHYPO_G00213910 [Pangasianodon hypophthalmus]|uniref:Uncharacterized protein n=1 Tax=Pangasianodon hypophthalmus TaxID=310915 RepID=A0A5N5P776_PANHP|nr:hypothetical protein PHYPO_G00213910 [Pangasianodon hypophthalmus]
MLPAPCRVLMTSELWLLSRCRAGLVRFSAKENLENRQRYRLDIATEGERPGNSQHRDRVSTTLWFESDVTVLQIFDVNSVLSSGKLEVI